MARASVFQAGRLLSLGTLAEHALMFLRVLIVARFLGPENFGIAVTFLLTVSTFALVSDLGIEKYVIQAREADFARGLPSLAAILALRGIAMAALIAVSAGWIARLFGNPDLAWFYALAAIVPLIEGFRHLGPLSRQRQMQFGPWVAVQLGGLVPGIALTIALAIATESYIAIAMGAIATSLISVALSHIVARSRYRLGFDRGAFESILSYGWPLLLSGMVIFLATQGDRIVVGAMEGMRDLAAYAAVAAITGGMSVFFAKLLGNLFLPLISESREDPAAYAARSRTTGAAALLVIACVVFPFASLGAPIVPVLFGGSYAVPTLLVTFLAILAAATVLRSWCVVISLSMGGTGDILAFNIVRVGGIVGAYLAVADGYGIVWVAASMCAGDVAATVLALWRVSRRSAEVRVSCLIFGSAFLLSTAAIIAANAVLPVDPPFALRLVIAVATSLPGLIVALLAAPDLRRRLANIAPRAYRSLR